MWSFIDDAELRWKESSSKNELWINYWNEETKIQGELSIVWYDLLCDMLIPKLEVFEDTWLALYQYGQDFLKMLAENNNKNLTKEEMKSKLLEIGFVDKTIDEI